MPIKNNVSDNVNTSLSHTHAHTTPTVFMIFFLNIHRSLSNLNKYFQKVFKNFILADWISGGSIRAQQDFQNGIKGEEQPLHLPLHLTNISFTFLLVQLGMMRVVSQRSWREALRRRPFQRALKQPLEVLYAPRIQAFKRTLSPMNGQSIVYYIEWNWKFS